MISNGRQKRKSTYIPPFAVFIGFVFCLLITLTGCSSDDSPPPVVQQEEKAFDLEATKVMNKPPVLKPVGDRIAYVGVPISVVLSALDSRDDALTYDIYQVDLPASETKKTDTLPNVTITNDPITKTYTWTWTPSLSGDYYFKATVDDNGSTILRDSDIFRVRVCESYVASEKIDLDFNFKDDDPNKPANFSPNMIATTLPSGVPVAGLSRDNFAFIDDNIPLQLDENNINLETSLRIFPATTDVLLLLDLSGSINERGFDEMKVGANKFVDYVLTTRQNIGIYYFNGDEKIHELISFVGAGQTESKIETAKQQLQGALSKLNKNDQPADSSNLYGAIIEGRLELDKRSKNSPTKINSLVVFSDGRDTAGRATIDEALKGTPSKIYEWKHNVITIGINISSTDTTRKGALIIDEQARIGKDGYFIAATKEDLVTRFVEAAFAVRMAGLKSYIMAFCMPHRGDFQHTLQTTATETVGTVARSSDLEKTVYSSKGFAGGCFAGVEKEKIKYFDFDGDGHYSVIGPLKDCDDIDPYNWGKCDTCEDKDQDGFGGFGCDINSDCQDDPEKEPNADLINPNMSDTTTDGWDQNCDKFDGKRS